MVLHWIFTYLLSIVRSIFCLPSLLNIGNFDHQLRSLWVRMKAHVRTVAQFGSVSPKAYSFSPHFQLYSDLESTPSKTLLRLQKATILSAELVVICAPQVD